MQKARITIELPVGDAITVLGVIGDAALASSKDAALTVGDEHEIHSLRARMLMRAAGRITKALYPEPDERIAGVVS